MPNYKLVYWFFKRNRKIISIILIIVILIGGIAIASPQFLKSKSDSKTSGIVKPTEKPIETKPATTATTKPEATATTETQTKPEPSTTPSSSTNTTQNAISNGKIKIQMYSGNGTSNMNSISPKFKLINLGDTVINLEDVKIRYYYTLETPKEQSFSCDWSPAGNSNITGKFVKIDSKKGADYYLEIGFTKGAGMLEKGKDTEIQVRANKTDWSNFNQTDDYSFNSATAYIDCDKVTGYINNNLQWGKEP